MGNTQERHQFVLFHNNGTITQQCFMALFSNHTPFSLEKTMTLTSTVCFFNAGLMYFYEANQTSVFTQEKISSYKIVLYPQALAMRNQQSQCDSSLLLNSHILGPLDILKVLNRSKLWLKNVKKTENQSIPSKHIICRTFTLSS